MTGGCFVAGQIDQDESSCFKSLIPLLFRDPVPFHVLFRQRLAGSQSRSCFIRFSDGLQATGQLRRARVPGPWWPAVWGQLPGQERRSPRGTAAPPLGHYAPGHTRQPQPAPRRADTAIRRVAGRARRFRSCSLLGRSAARRTACR